MHYPHVDCHGKLGGTDVVGCDGECGSGRVVGGCDARCGSVAVKGCDGVCRSGMRTGCDGVCNSDRVVGCDGACGPRPGKAAGCDGVCGSGAAWGCDSVCGSGAVRSCGACAAGRLPPCADCPLGAFRNATGTGPGCDPCLDPQARPPPGGRAPAECVCAPGHVPDGGSGACKPCPFDCSMCGPGEPACVECARDHYMGPPEARPGRLQCVPCPPGTVSPAGSPNSDYCHVPPPWRPTV